MNLIKSKVKKKLKESVVLINIYNRIPFNNQFKIDKGNEIIVGGGVITKCQINVHGSGNKIIIGNYCNIQESLITINGNNNTLFIGDSCNIISANPHFEDDGGLIYIGDKTCIAGRTHIACIEGKKIKIGSNCLFSSDITIRVGDSHSILDMEGKRINPSKDVNIGDHVWIGNKTIILKGSEIADDSIVGSGAVVSGKYTDNNVVIAGNPAKIIKRDITWKYERN